MKTTIIPSPIGGEINSIPSKSHAHRMIICSALSSETTKIECPLISKDIDATLNCIESLGSKIIKKSSGFVISGFYKEKSLQNGSNEFLKLHCGESGSTYRFLFPVACALNSVRNKKSNSLITSGFEFILEGRLPERPMKPLFSVLEEHGAEISGKNTSSVKVSGKLKGGIFNIPGNISSQFISGLIFALPLLDSDSIINITDNFESRKYVDITLDAVKQFGIKLSINNNKIMIPGNQKYISPKKIDIDGDWSNSAFWLCASALSGKQIKCKGLNVNSHQGDKEICNILKSFGCNISVNSDIINCNPDKIKGIKIDASQIPDLVPAIAAVAAGAEGATEIYNAERLRIKESDRLSSIADVLSKLGADITEKQNGFIIKGRKKLNGGKVDSWNDHRIVMMAAITSIICENPVEIDNSEAVMKSYPGFFDDFIKLGGKIE